MSRLLSTVLCAIFMMSLMAVSASAAQSQLAGIQLHVLWSGVTQAETERQLDLVRNSGARLARVDVGWASLQQTSGSRYEEWFVKRLDHLVAAAEARDIELLLTFMNTPCWASSAPDSLKQSCAGAWWDRGVTIYPPKNPADYARALAYLVGRYKERVAAWEIWNEPNLADFWAAADKARAYVDLVKAAYPVAKAAHPGSTIVAGSLSQSDYRFTQQLYDLGIKGYFDAFAVHPYSEDASPYAARSDARYSFVNGVPKIRETMLANGDSRPIWLTESGFSTSTIRNRAAWENGVSESTQAQYIREQAEIASRWDYVHANVYFNLLDGPDRAERLDNYGLRRWDGTAKPAWNAFREAAQLLQDGEASGGETPGSGENPPPTGGETPGSGENPPPTGGETPGSGENPPPTGGSTTTPPPGGSTTTPPPGGRTTKPVRGRRVMKRTTRKKTRRATAAAKRRAAARAARAARKAKAARAARSAKAARSARAARGAAPARSR